MKVTFLIFGESFDEWIEVSICLCVTTGSFMVEMDSDRIQPTEFVPKSKSKSVMHPRKRKMKNRRAHGRTASNTQCLKEHSSNHFNEIHKYHFMM